MVEFFASVAEGKVRLEFWGSDRAGDIADVLEAVEELVAFDREGFQAVGQAEAAQFFVDVAEGVNAVNDFLPKVTAFVVADGAAFDAALDGDVGFVHVCAKARDAGFDAGGLESAPAASTTASGLGGGEKLAGSGLESSRGDK